MSHRGTAGRAPRGRFITWFGVVTLAVAAWGWQLVGLVAADGSDVAAKLGSASSVVGGLSGSIAKDSEQGGEYADEANARSVPFLGGTPGSLLPGVFNALGPLSGFNNFAPGDDEFVKVVDDKVNQVDASLSGDNNFPSRVYMCGQEACKLDISKPDASKVGSLTSIELQLAVGGSSSGTIDFDSLGLPSIGFALPKNDTTKLNVNLSWSITARLVADGNRLRLAPSGDAANPNELSLAATISLPTKSFKVNLGALVVKATEETAPQFKGTLLVNVDDNANLSFGFGPDSGFKARWGLVTENSPLMGVEGDLDICWPLGGAGLCGDATELTIKVEDISIDTRDFVGKDVQEAAASLRDVTHPIRTVTSPLLEPIPGLSDVSEALDGGDVTLLRIMEEANGFPPEVRTTLKRLQALDDVAAALAGDEKVPLGSFTLVGDDALKPINQPLREAALNTLKNIYDECEKCKETVDNLLNAVGAAPPGQNGFQFDVPVLRQPASLAGLLLGRDVELITFDTGKLGYPKDDLNIPIARFLIFSAKIVGEIEASIHLKGGVDTKGISDALRNGDAADVLNGVYLQNPGSNDPVVRVYSDASLAAAVGIEVVEARLEGGPKANITLRVPQSVPDGKLRPAIVKDGIGCALLEADDAKAEFSVFVKAVFDYWIDEEEEILAEHTFLTEQDLCEPDAKDIEPAYAEDRTLVIRTAAERLVPDNEADSVKVYMRHDPTTGQPTWIVVTVNDNNHKDYAANEFDRIRYTSSGTRPVMLEVVRSDEKPFEKDVFVETGDGPDDVLVDSASFSRVAVNGGDDKVIVTAGGSLVSGGDGNDYITGGDNTDFLNGNAGDDTVDGAGGVDILNGESGIDVIIDSSGDGNCLSGGADNDLIIDGPGANFLNGDEPFCGTTANRDPLDDGTTSDGSDDIVTGGGADIVVAGDKDDEVRLHSSAVADRENAAWSAGVRVHGNGGNDDITTGNGQDWIHGGSGDDVINSDAGPKQETALRNGEVDTVYGGLGADKVHANDGNDLVYGDNGTHSCMPPITGQPTEVDTPGGADEVHGGNGADRIALEAGDDKAFGGDGDDTICGHGGADTINGDGDPDPRFGSSGDDLVFGGTSSDTVDGEAGADELFGNDGADLINGGDDDDRIVGGSSAAATADAGDTIRGDAGLDVLIGDNGSIAAGPPAAPSVYDLFANNATLGGNDTIEGGDDADRAFGGIGDDTIRGGNADDHLEGNNGDDAIYGDANEDDIIGGTSPESLPGAAAGQTAADAPDGGETILSGGFGRDVILGDNGVITRPGGVDPIIGGVARAVTLLDRDRSGAALDAVSGGDYIEGNDDPDRLYGEGGDDYIKGNSGDDYAEGNQAADRLEGNDGEDDLIGGSSFTSAPGVGDPDDGDQIAGGAGADVILGDNAQITRATTGSGSGFDWDTVANNWLGPVARRSITLLDKQTLNAGRFGNDVLSGGAGPDVMFGQDGNDGLYGGSDDDYQEGNGGNDVLFGDQVAPPTGDARESAQPELDGTYGPAGQDDQLGGSSWVKATAANGAVTGQRDGNDELHGDGNADVQLGDNGKVLRRIVNGQYETFQQTTGKPTIVRQAATSGISATALPARFDVGASAATAVWGNDVLYGDDGDDLQLGQDGDDTLYGGNGDDDMYGELGNDRMFGEADEDAMVGDRGVITNRLVTTPGATFSVSGPPQISFTPYAAHPLDRRVDLNDDGDGVPLQAPGMTTGGNDFMRGGSEHDSMHGAAANDLMNGDSGGDYLFGDDGVDVMWGGKGRECADPSDLACNSDHGVNDAYVDYLFGGRGLKTDPVTGGADLLDFRPRPGVDPAAWFEITSTRASDAIADHQHHQGIDWIYGGWDRDVMQADIADNGPNQGDRLIDWTGAYNLYNHCPAAYGGFNDVRQFSPSMQSFLQQLAFALGAGKSLADVQTKGTSGYNELALVYNADVKSNSGSAYPSTPGHFDDFSCAP